MPIDGFFYQPEFLTEDDERRLACMLAALEFGEVRMRGIAARRRVLHFGWLYGYESWRLSPGPPIPPPLLPLGARLAKFVGVEPDALAEALVSEYRAGAGIGWHRDAPRFGIVAAVSLVGACRMRFRRGEKGAWEVREVELAPRSAYALTREARSHWQHSIPPARELRYSITFRTLLTGL